MPPSFSEALTRACGAGLHLFKEGAEGTNVSRWALLESRKPYLIIVRKR